MLDNSLLLPPAAINIYLLRLPIGRIFSFVRSFFLALKSLLSKMRSLL